MTSRIFILLAALCAVVGLADAVSACVCMSVPVGTTFDHSDVVFVGTIDEMTPEPTAPLQIGDREFPRNRLVVRFAVTERFKGVDTDRVVLIATGEDTTCAIGFAVGKRFLVFAQHSVDVGGLVTSMCDLTARVEFSGSNLAYCRHVTRTGAAPRIAGVVREPVTSVIAGAGEEHRPLAGISVVLTSRSTELTATTDLDGGFAFAEVPSGEYTVRFGLPDGWRLLDFQASGIPDTTLVVENRVVVKDSTVVVNASVTSSGGITGRLVDTDGHLLEGIILHAIPRERAEKPRLDEQFPMGISNERGEFRFDVLPVGEYVVVVNSSPLAPRIDRPPLPGYILKDLVDARRTRVLAVKPGKLIDLGKVVVPPNPPFVVVAARIVDEQGRPARGAIECRLESGELVGVALLENEGARPNLYLPTGGVLRLTGIAFGPRGKQVSEPVVVDPAKPPREIKLVIGIADEP